MLSFEIFKSYFKLNFYIFPPIKGSPLWKFLTVGTGLIFIGFVGVLIFYLHKFWKKSETQEAYIRGLNAKDIEEFKFGRRQALVQFDGWGNERKDDGKELALYLPYNEEEYGVNENDLILGTNEKRLSCFLRECERF